MNDKISEENLVLLLGEEKKYVVKPMLFSCQFGTYDLRKLIGKKYGKKIKLGKKSFTVVKPNITDLVKKATRGPQIILPKDFGVIISVTGCSPGWKVVDAGTGSGFLSMYLANMGCQVYTYEKKKDFYDIGKKNFKKFGLDIKAKNADITKGIKEKNVDMITLDLQNPEKVVKHAFNSLKKGGWLVVYSMHIEEAKNVHREIKKYDFTGVKILESLRREWQSIKEFTRPRTYMMAHTAFLTFARKM